MTALLPKFDPAGMERTQAEEIAWVRDAIRSGLARKIRQDAEVPQLWVAADLGLTHTAVSHWECGRRIPHGAVAIRYARLLRRLQRQAQRARARASA